MRGVFAIVCVSVVLPCASCAHGVIALSTALPVVSAPSGVLPIEVIARAAGVANPLPMKGSCNVFGAVEESLGHAVATATMPWAEAHRAGEPEGWQLMVDLWQASAEHRAGSVTVQLGVRATLRTRDGNRYVAQTQAHCKQTQLVRASDGAQVFYGCMNSLGRELFSWLESVKP